VSVPSPQQDISRSHVEVRLEGWHVLAVDLNTTNGTTLLRAGQPPLRMHPGEPVLVVSGDVVDLGDDVTLTFVDVP
jgi:pSer/pThr/pTyr-binding forkhead associated (FHA) protein